MSQNPAGLVKAPRASVRALAVAPPPPPAPVVAPPPPGATSSRFWGVSWDRVAKKWMARYTDANKSMRTIGRYDDEDEAAKAVNKALKDNKLEGKRRMNPVDASTGKCVPRVRKRQSDRSAVVAPDPTATTSKFWGVHWSKGDRRWKATYNDVENKTTNVGLYDTQELAAHAYNAAISANKLEDRRKTNPVDANGQLVPRDPRKRRREEEAPATVPRFGPPRSRYDPRTMMPLAPRRSWQE